jgi:predicted RNA-binding Zn-ribbon protein involved in translation (DUF1610 family)
VGGLYEFTCPACGYAADVSGGPDVGLASATVTISCATCRKLRDVVVSNEPWKRSPDAVPDHPRCPSSRTRVHKTELWSHPGPCPQCGATMRVGTLTVIWD